MIDEATRRARAYLGLYVDKAGRCSDDLVHCYLPLPAYYIRKEFLKLVGMRAMMD